MYKDSGETTCKCHYLIQIDSNTNEIKNILISLYKYDEYKQFTKIISSFCNKYDFNSLVLTLLNNAIDRLSQTLD